MIQNKLNSIFQMKKSIPLFLLHIILLIIMVSVIFILKGEIRVDYSYQDKIKDKISIGYDFRAQFDNTSFYVRNYISTGNVTYIRNFDSLMKISNHNGILNKAGQLEIKEIHFDKLKISVIHFNAQLNLWLKALRLYEESKGISESEMNPIIASYRLPAELTSLSPEEKRSKAKEILYSEEFEKNNFLFNRAISNYKNSLLNELTLTSSERWYHHTFFFYALIIVSLIFFFLIVRDLLKRLKNEEDIKVQKKWYETILTSIGDAVIATDEQGIIVFMNNTAKALTGWRTDFANTDIEEVFTLYDDKSGKPIINPVRIVIENKLISSTLENSFLKSKEGASYLIEQVTTPILDENNNFKGAVVVFRDITKEKQAEISLKDAEDKLNIIANTSKDVFYSLIFETMTYNYISPAIVQLTGYTAEEINKFGFKKIVRKIEQVGRSEVTLQELIDKRLINSEYAHSAEYLIETKDGRLIWVDDRSFPQFDDNNNTIGTVGILRDITERKNFEKRIIEERNKAKAYFDTVNQMMVILDKNANVIDINEKGTKIFGLKYSSIVGKNWLDSFVPDKLKDEVTDSFNKLFSGKFGREAYHINAIINSKNEERIIGWHNALLTDSEGNPTHLIGSGEDITEKLKTENQLKESEERWRHLLEYSPIGIAIIKGTDIVYVNSEMIKIAGAASKDDLVGKTVARFIMRERILFIKRFINSVKENKEKIYFFEDKMRTVDGRFIDVEASAIPMWYEGALSVQLLLKDITQRKQEEKVQNVIQNILHAANSEKNLEQLFKFIHEEIGKLISVRNFYIALYDEESSIVSFPYSVDEFDEAADPVTFGKGLTEFVIRNGESFLLRKDEYLSLYEKGEIDLVGTPTSVWLGIPLKILDKTIGVMTLQDYINPNAYTNYEKNILEVISYPVSRAIERKIVEEERQKLIEQLKETNTSKDKFFSLISHDLRSPFNALLGFSDILHNEFNSLTNSEIKHYIASIYNSSHNLFAMLSNLLHYSRFQLGRFEYKPVNLNLKAALLYNVELLKGNAQKKNITIEFKVDENFHVFADEDMFNSIFQNIISNAIKFTQKHGSIRISADKINSNGKKYLQTIISDTGLGMEKEVVDNLFKIDNIHSTPGTERELGTGLGLVLVYEFVEKNLGMISVESKLNEGTTFYVLLPAGNNS